MQGELFGVLPLFECFLSAAMQRRKEIVRKMEMAREMNMEKEMEREIKRVGDRYSKEKLEIGI
jgi:hypothetical protein